MQNQQNESYNADNGALRYDEGKTEFHLLPSDGIAELAKVYMFGAKKYKPYNWERGMLWSRCFNSLLRHVYAYWDGEKCDPETGLHHMAHAAWNALALLVYSLRGIGIDDRKASLISAQQNEEAAQAEFALEEPLPTGIDRSPSKFWQNRALDNAIDKVHSGDPEMAAHVKRAFDDRKLPIGRLIEGTMFRIEDNGPVWKVKKVLVENTAELGNQLFEAQCVSHPELPDQMMRAKAIHSFVMEVDKASHRCMHCPDKNAMAGKDVCADCFAPVAPAKNCT